MPRAVGDWTRDKLKILESYLPAYLEATTRARQRFYVDAFAGPGLNQLRASGDVIDGSPIIALKSSGRNGTRFTKLFFIESDLPTCRELRENIRLQRAEDRCEVIHGDVNEQLPRVIRRLHQRAPTFVFLDTEGIEPKWSTIEAIAPWRVELLINFPLGMSINRNRASAKAREYFGTEECLPLLSGLRSGRTGALLDLYKRRLKELGWLHTTEDDRLVKTEFNQRLYYLVFASKHTAGETIMNAVYRQPDVRGQSRLRFDL